MNELVQPDTAHDGDRRDDLSLHSVSFCVIRTASACDGVRWRQRERRVHVLIEANGGAVAHDPRVRRGVAGILAGRPEAAMDPGEGDNPLAAADDVLELEVEAFPCLADPLEEPPDSVAPLEVASVAPPRVGG